MFWGGGADEDERYARLGDRGEGRSDSGAGEIPESGKFPGRAWSRPTDSARARISARDSGGTSGTAPESRFAPTGEVSENASAAGIPKAAPGSFGTGATAGKYRDRPPLRLQRAEGFQTTLSFRERSAARCAPFCPCSRARGFARPIGRTRERRKYGLRRLRAGLIVFMQKTRGLRPRVFRESKLSGGS